MSKTKLTQSWDHFEHMRLSAGCTVAETEHLHHGSLATPCCSLAILTSKTLCSAFASISPDPCKTPSGLLFSSLCNFISKSLRLAHQCLPGSDTLLLKPVSYSKARALLSETHRSLPRIPGGQGSGPPPSFLQPAAREVLRCKSWAEETAQRSPCPAWAKL